jgi:tetratricopeptide (TPR) repeat protein
MGGRRTKNIMEITVELLRASHSKQGATRDLSRQEPGRPRPRSSRPRLGRVRLLQFACLAGAISPSVFRLFAIQYTVSASPAYARAVNARLSHYPQLPRLFPSVKSALSPEAAGDQLKGSTPANPSDNAQQLVLKAREAEQSRDFRAAARFYRQYLETNAASADVLQRLGLVEYLSNRFDDAIGPLTQALRLDPSLWGSALYLGMSYYRTDRFKEAVRSLGRALALKPHIAEAQFWLGCSLIADNQAESAIPHLLEAGADPAWRLQSETMLVKAYRRAAVDSYQRIAAVAPDSERVHLAKAHLLEWKGANNGTIWESRQALRRNPEVEGAHRIIGDVYWREKGFEQAAKEFQAELLLNPLDGESNLRLGEFWLAKGDVKRAMPSLMTAVQQRAGSPGEAYHFLGEADMAQTDYAKAIADLQHAAAANPSDAANHRLLAQAYLASGQPELAASEDQLSRSAAPPSVQNAEGSPTR